MKSVHSIYGEVLAQRPFLDRGCIVVLPGAIICPMASRAQSESWAATSPYQFKASPYSSHTILLANLPEPGQGKRVLDVGCGDGYLGEILAARGY